MFEIVAIAILGWLAGALVNYISDVLPYERRLIAPFCHQCANRYGLVNYLIWPRECQQCGNRRPVRVWLVEIGYILATLWLWRFPPPNLNFWLGLILLVYFGMVTIIDLEHRLIMHPVSVVGGLLGLGIGVWMHGVIPTLTGGVVGFTVMLAFYYLGTLFVKFRSKGSVDFEFDDALGFGDVNLSAILGLILGWPGILAGLFLAILLAGVVSIFYIMILVALRRYNSNLAIAYGPYLVASAVALLYLRPYLSV
jgi:leader peptidase (prepilin peptidase)/N-methyltransferase